MIKFNIRISGKNYVTHDSAENLHQSENWKKQITPKGHFRSSLSEPVSYTLKVNIT